MISTERPKTTSSIQRIEDGFHRPNSYFSKTFIDLRSTRPPPKPSHATIIQTEIQDPEKIDMYRFGKDSREIDELPPPKIKTRRANPIQKKRDRELKEILSPKPNESSRIVNKGSKALFSELDPEGMKRLHARIIHFCRESNGALLPHINLRDYSIESGETITNTIIQELCSVHTGMTGLDLSECDQVSDVGLWSIARHSVDLKTLILSACNGISNVGLRSLSLRCASITTLNFSDCLALDDIGLTVIAGGCWKLSTLILKGCINITDTGVGKVVKSSERLQTLDLNGCIKVGDFGDHALKEIATYCPSLTYLDLGGCKRVEDAGLRSLAVGCVHLKTLLLSGCEGVTGGGLKTLFKHARSLETFSLIGCKQIQDSDFETLQNSLSQHSLTSLNVSGCTQLTDTGVALICQSLGPNLRQLNLSQCAATDFSSVIISNFCPNLRELNLCSCPLITDTSVQTIARKVFRLTTLRLDGCPKITTRTVLSHVSNLEFADLSYEWLGYTPKNNSELLIQEKEVFLFQTQHVLRIQCAMRRKFAYKKYKEKRRWYLMNVIIPKFQAIVRRYPRRKEYISYLYQQWLIENAIKIQSWFRCRICVRKFDLTVRTRMFLAYKQRMAIIIQRVFRGFIGRQRVMDLRIQNANQRLKRTKKIYLKNRSAVLIQRIWRGVRARNRVRNMRSVIEAKRIRMALEDNKTRELQRVARGMIGRMKVKQIIRDLHYKHFLWQQAKFIQRIVRGFLIRRMFAEMREKWRTKIINDAATEIQRYWRGFRSRMLAALAEALRKLRIKQSIAAIEIQRIARGIIGRRRAMVLKELFYEKQRRLKAVLLIQRIFRGHKGKEAREIETRLLEFESQSRPLTIHLKQLEEKFMIAKKQLDNSESKEDLMAKELELIEREWDMCMKSTNQHTDSARITGIPQRYLTKFLRIRLKDHLEHHKQELLSLIHSNDLARTETRNLSSQIKYTLRELLPLTTGALARCKKERSKRLRDCIRAQRKGAVSMQKIWRGSLVRFGYHDVYRDSWIECLDETQAEKAYYFNTISQQTSWTKPLAMKYFYFDIQARKKFVKARIRAKRDAMSK